MKLKFTLVQRSDTYNFPLGKVLELMDLYVGPLDRVRTIWLRMTRWWRTRMVVSAVDAENGVITLIQERWSWRRWRWEERP